MKDETGDIIQSKKKAVFPNGKYEKINFSR